MDFSTSLENYLSKEEIIKLEQSLNDVDKHALIVNVNKTSIEEIKAIYPNIIPHPIVKNAFLYDKNEYALGKSLEHELGLFYLQEPSAMLPAYYLNANEDDFVLDICAAPGGKSIQTSFLMKNKGEILANDLSRERQNATLENIERLGINNISLISTDLSKFVHLFKDTFTKIILDAPCSGSGMFRKEEKMKDDWSIEKVYKFAAIQKEMILYAYDMLMPGGKLVYSTCSYSLEENEEVIQYLLDNSDAEIIPLDDINLYKSKFNLGVHTMPFMFPGEGQYICLISKPGNLINKHLENRTLMTFGETKFLAPSFKLKNVPIIRLGTKYSTIKGNYEAFEFHYARTLNEYKNTIELTKEETLSYIEGNQINKKSPYKGEVLLTYNHHSICFAKTDGEVIKNRYPKGLRKTIK